MIFTPQSPINPPSTPHNPPPFLFETKGKRRKNSPVGRFFEVFPHKARSGRSRVYRGDATWAELHRQLAPSRRDYATGESKRHFKSSHSNQKRDPARLILQLCRVFFCANWINGEFWFWQKFNWNSTDFSSIIQMYMHIRYIILVRC